MSNFWHRYVKYYQVFQFEVSQCNSTLFLCVICYTIKRGPRPLKLFAFHSLPLSNHACITNLCLVSPSHVFILSHKINKNNNRVGGNSPSRGELQIVNIYVHTWSITSAPGPAGQPGAGYYVQCVWYVSLCQVPTIASSSGGAVSRISDENVNIEFLTGTP